MRRILVFVLCLATSHLHAQTSAVTIDTMTNYNSWKWKSVVMKNGLITVATVPAIGGRVMQYDIGGHASIMNNSALWGKTYTPANGQWYNFGGYKTWPSPQYRWPDTWPPPPTLDYGNYAFQMGPLSSDSVSVLVTSPIEQWIATGIQFQRKATIYPGTSRVNMQQTIINTGSATASWGVWSIIQSIANHTGKTDFENFWAYFPVNPKSVDGPSGVLPEKPSTAWKGLIAPGVYGVQYVTSDTKIFADPDKGWIAYSDKLDSVVYARTFDVFNGASYPDSARVTVYVSGATAPYYMEVEVKAPVVALAPNGGSYTFTENWWAAKVRAPIVDINGVGAIAQHLSYNSATGSFSAVYGVFYQGTARIALLDSRGQSLGQSRSLSVSPLTEFFLQENMAIPDSAKKAALLMYNAGGQFVGTLDSLNTSDLSTGIKGAISDLPSRFALEQNYPNPFNPSTTIGYELPVRASVKLSVYDMLGREVRVVSWAGQSSGHHSMMWDGMDRYNHPLPSGMYVYRLQAHSFEDGRIFDASAKMVLVK